MAWQNQSAFTSPNEKKRGKKAHARIYGAVCENEVRMIFLKFINHISGSESVFLFCSKLFYAF